MSRDTINAICRTFPGAELSDPWGGGHDAWKVGGKMFACIGSKLPERLLKLNAIGRGPSEASRWRILMPGMAFFGISMPGARGPNIFRMSCRMIFSV